jgi:hypothetical protein
MNWRVSIAVVLLLALIVWIARPGQEPAAIPIDAGGASARIALPLTHAAAQADPEAGDYSYIELSVRGLPTEGCEHRPRPYEELSPEEQKAIEDSLVAASETLSRTDAPDLLLASALLSPDPESRWRRVSRALALSPQDPVALWHQLQYCDEVGCDRQAIELAATTIDQSNGMVWLEIAGDRIRAGKWSEAEAALRSAVSSPRFDTYFIDYALVVERGLAAVTDRPYSDRVMHGTGIAAAFAIPGFGDVSSACRSDDNDPLVWVDLCNDLGEQMSDVSQELITTMIGYGYRRAAAMRAGDEAASERIEQQSRRFSDDIIRQQALAGAQVLMQNDPAVLQDYIENFLSHGEIAAMDLLVKDARRLRDDPDYDQCNFVGDPDYNL